MADVFSKSKRSEVMSRIRSTNTRPELIVRKFIHREGFRYRLHVKNLQGKPDLVLPKYKTAIFINGCFWHGHENCNLFQMPKSNKEFWSDKINKNIIRDKSNIARLAEIGWKVIVIWECQLNSVLKDTTLKNLVTDIKTAPIIDVDK